MRAALLLTLGLLAGSVAGQAASAAQSSLELSAAWGGMSRPTRMTEIRVRLSTPLAGAASVRVQAGPALIESDIALAALQPAELRIPVPAAESIKVHATFPGGATLERELTLRLAEAPLMALGAMALGALPEEIAKTEIDAAGYPSQAAAYEAIDAIAIDAPTLGRFDHQQLEALISYVGRCGPTVAIELPPATAALLRSQAGCGARALLLVGGALPADAIPKLLATAPRGPASGANLQGLLAPAPGPWPLIAASLTSYLVVGALLALFVRRLWPVLLYALLATVLVPVAQHLATPLRRLSVWAETESQDRGARYSAVMEMRGTGHFPRTLKLPGLLGDAEPCNGIDSDSAPRWKWDATRSRYDSMTFDQTLFGAASVCWRGDFPVSRAANVESRGDTLLVSNRGAEVWPAGVALRDGRLYALPSIEPGRASSTRRSDTAVKDSPATDLAILRVGNRGCGLLWPLQMPALGFVPDSTRAYLLLRCTGVGS